MRSAISKSGSNVSLAAERWQKMEKPKRARKRKLDTAKVDLKFASRSIVEGRVSIVRWNPKGMRRSTGP
jgi:hypothetical protein